MTWIAPMPEPPLHRLDAAKLSEQALTVGLWGWLGYELSHRQLWLEGHGHFPRWAAVSPMNSTRVLKKWLDLVGSS